MSKLNIQTLAANAARAKRRLIIQQERVAKLSEQLVKKVGTGGRTITTSLGQVIVTAETVDRNGPGFVMTFNQEKFHELDPKVQMQLQQAGVVHTQKIVIRGQAPKVQFRLNTEQK